MKGIVCIVFMMMALTIVVSCQWQRVSVEELAEQIDEDIIEEEEE